MLYIFIEIGLDIFSAFPMLLNLAMYTPSLNFLLNVFISDIRLELVVLTKKFVEQNAFINFTINYCIRDCLPFYG